MSEILLSNISNISNVLLDISRRDKFKTFILDFKGKRLLVNSIKQEYINGFQYIVLNNNLRLLFSNTFIDENIYDDINSLEELRYILNKLTMLAISCTKDSSIDIFKYDVGKILANSNNVIRLLESGNKNLPDFIFSSENTIKLEIIGEIVSISADNGELNHIDSLFRKQLIKKELLNSLFLFQIPKKQNIDIKSILEIVNYLHSSNADVIKTYEYFTNNSVYIVLQISPKISVQRLFNYPLDRLKSIRISDTTGLLESILR